METKQIEIVEDIDVLKQCDLIHEITISMMNIPLNVFNPEILN